MKSELKLGARLSVILPSDPRKYIGFQETR